MTSSLVHLINYTIVEIRRLQVLILMHTSQLGDFGLFILSQSNSLYWDAVMGKKHGVYCLELYKINAGYKVNNLLSSNTFCSIFPMPFEHRRSCRLTNTKYNLETIMFPSIAKK